MSGLWKQDLDEAVERVGASWRELAGAHVLMTGGTGFFGRWLVESVLRADERHGLGVRLSVLTRSPEGFAARAPGVAGDARVDLIAGDVRSFEAPRERVTHVVHGAVSASAKLSETAPLEMWSTIVDGTRHVLEMAAGARSVLFVSSGAVYGRQREDVERIGEEYEGGPDPLEARSCYGEGKRAAEQLCALYGRERGLNVKIARCFAFAGPLLPLDEHFAVGNFVRDALAGRAIRIAADGTPLRSYLYAGDLAAWLWKILVEGEPLRAYNVGSERAVSIAELARTVAETLRPGLAVEIAQAPGGRRERYVPSTERARRELGLEEWTPLEEQIRRMARWHGWEGV